MVLSLVLGWATIYANRTCLYPLLPLIAATLDITSAQAGLLSSVYFTLYVLFQIPSGLLMDRLGTKKCLVAAYSASGLALFGIGLLGDSYGWLLLFFGIQGLGDSFYYTAAQTTIVTYAPPQRKSLYSALLGVGMSLGTVAGLGFSHMLYAYFEGYRIPFLLLAFPTLAIAGALACFVPNVVSSKKTSAADYLPLFCDRDIWRISGAIFCLMYGFWVILNWGPTFLASERGFVAEQAGFYSGLVALAAVPGGIFWSRLSDRIGRKTVLAAVLPLSAFFLFSVASVESFHLMVLSLLAFGFCTNAAVVPVAVLWISHITASRYAGRTAVAISFFNCLIVASAVVAPVLSGFIRDLSGSLAGAIFLGAGVVLTGPLLIAGIRETREIPSVSNDSSGGVAD